ncbi:MAG: sigma-70 family RNA polymerase sigma factor, partial [Gemmatimonadales bacterium]
MLDERQAVEQARRGHEAAWRYLYEGHAGFVFRLAVRTTGDRAAALDVVQATFARAAAGIGRFRGESSFRSWLARIAINETTNWVRRQAWMAFVIPSAQFQWSFNRFSSPQFNIGTGDLA